MSHAAFRPALSSRLVFCLGLLAAALLPLAARGAQAAPTPAADTPAADAPDPGRQQRIEEFWKSLHPKQGAVSLPGGVATLQVPNEFYYYDPADSRRIIVDLWHNPPDRADDVLGLLRPVPREGSAKSWGVVITSEEQGYVKDSEADKINYNDLLKKLQQGTEDSNAKRQQAGYDPIHLVGWATPPRYDRAAKKMYWAKELQFGNDPDHTLNYDIRILGRRGVLSLNAVAGMDELAEIEQVSPQILSMVNYTQGNRYADFNPKTDKVAEYGLAGLVIGGLLLKAGGLKAILVALLALKKFIIIGLVAVGSFFKRIFTGRGVKTHDTPGS